MLMIPLNCYPVLIVAFDFITNETRADGFAATTCWSWIFAALSTEAPRSLLQTKNRWRSTKDFVTMPVSFWRPCSAGTQVSGALPAMGVLSCHQDFRKQMYFLDPSHNIAFYFESINRIKTKPQCFKIISQDTVQNISSFL